VTNLLDRLLQIDLDWLSSSIEYDEDSPSGLCWKVYACNNAIKPGDVAGCRHHSGYFVLGVRIRNEQRCRTTYCHHIVLLLHDNWPQPHQECDHIDRDRGNNKIVNLIWSTKSGNAINRASRNRFGVPYVSFDKHCLSSPYRAQWWDPFSKKMMYAGMHSTPEQASAVARQALRQRLLAEADRAERGEP
jgi:hypothetical protein